MAEFREQVTAGSSFVTVRGYAVPERWTWTRESIEQEADKPAPPDVTVHFQVRDGIPECVAVHVTARADGRGIRSSDLGRLTLEALTQDTMGELALAPAPGGGFMWMGELSAEGLRGAANAMQEVAQGPKTKRSRLLETARVYLSDSAGHPRRAVAMRFGKSDRTAARYVAEAREAGLIPDRAASDEERVAALERVREEIAASGVGATQYVTGTEGQTDHA